MIDKKAVPTKLLWLDLEMTGLDPKKDIILEVGVEITDFDFKTLATYEACVQHPKDQVVKLLHANSWYQDYPENRDNFIANLDKGKPLAQVEAELVSLVEEHFGTEPAILAGNSIHSDRLFIREYMKELDLKLHYRMLDVTSWKIVMQGKFGQRDFKKPEVHRAFEDIQGSIAELQYYLDWLQKRK